MGREVLDGSGLAVSDGKGVSVEGSVAVIGENAVFVTTDGSLGVGVIWVDVDWQAVDATIHKIEKNSFRLIC